MTVFSAESFDVAVIGAGHAGIEAALAAARLGAKTACFSINLDAVGNMPCNPAIGGTASTACSTAARVRQCTRCVHRPTALNTESI